MPTCTVVALLSLRWINSAMVPSTLVVPMMVTTTALLLTINTNTLRTPTAATLNKSMVHLLARTVATKWERCGNDVFRFMS